MTCPHPDTVITDARPTPTGEILVTWYCRLCGREWVALRDRDEDD